jgi:hypothetical protein
MLAYVLPVESLAYMPLAETSPHEWRALHSRLQVLARNRGAADAEEAKLLREAERLRIWREVGEPGMLAYVERVLGYGPRSAYDRLRVARALAELPLIERALASGEMFYSVVRELTRVVVWETEDEWLARAKGKSLREVEGLVSGREKGDRPDAPSKPEAVRHVLTHEVSAETHALVRQARMALQEEVGERLDDDAFLAMVMRRALQPAPGDGPPERIALMKCEDCKRTWQDGGGAVFEVPRETVERVECDAEHMDEHGKTSRNIPAPTRRLVLQRDHHRCRVPWCRSSHNLQPHHIEHFARGGNHDAENLVTLCWRHHKALHDGGLILRMENGEPCFERIETPPLPANETRPASLTETAVGALVTMGFTKSEARSFVEVALAHGGKSATLTQLVREALRRSPMPRSS